MKIKNDGNIDTKLKKLLLIVVLLHLFWLPFISTKILINYRYSLLVRWLQHRPLNIIFTFKIACWIISTNRWIEKWNAI